MGEPDAAPTPAGERADWRRRGLIGLVVLALVALIAQPLRLRVVAAATVADSLDLAVPRPFAAEVERHDTTVAALEADVYAPPASGWDDGPPSAAAGSVVVLIPGATPAGRDDRRVVALAEAFARSDRVVVVPELEVYDEDLVPEDIERIIRLVRALSEMHGPVVLTGISFGGSLALVAAADPGLADRVALVGTFGAFADLAGVIQAATTGVAIVDGERFPWDADPRAEDVVREQILRLLAPDERERLTAALEGEVPPDTLPADLRATYDLLVNDDPEAVSDLVADLPRTIQDRLATVSPARAAAELGVPLIALHARDDPVIPYGELHRLGTVYPQAELMSLTTFDHVGIDPDREVRWWVTARDLWVTTRFVAEVLAAQD